MVFGHNPHHPGEQTTAGPPRVRDFEFTFVIEGQEGRLAWGRNFSSAANTNEPLALAIAADGKTVIGADTEGFYHITLLSPDRLELCYAHSGVSPSRSIVASCAVYDREKK